MSERIKGIEDKLDFLVDAEKRRDEKCAGHALWIASVQKDVAELKEFKAQSEAVGATIVKAGQFSLAIGAALVGAYKFIESILPHFKGHQ